MSTFDESPKSFFSGHLKNIIIAIVSLIVILGGFFLIQKSLTPTDNFKALDVMVRATNPTIGKADSKVELLYLYDYLCPACQSNAENMKTLETDYKDKIKITYKHFIVHAGTGDRAAYAAQAARMQGGVEKFFEFSHALIKITPNYNAGVPQSNLNELAKSIGLDVPKFEKDYTSLEAENAVKLDQKDIKAAKLPVSKYPNPQDPTSTKPGSTPTLILIKDGKYTDSWWAGVLPVETVKQRVDEVLNKQ
jgi:protein-disulfide isomerase